MLFLYLNEKTAKTKPTLNKQNTKKLKNKKENKEVKVCF
jgi:hypothetical protein